MAGGFGPTPVLTKPPQRLVPRGEIQKFIVNVLFGFCLHFLSEQAGGSYFIKLVF